MHYLTRTKLERWESCVGEAGGSLTCTDIDMTFCDTLDE